MTSVSPSPRPSSATGADDSLTVGPGPLAGCPVHPAGDGPVLDGFVPAKAVLMADAARQAGFQAERIQDQAYLLGTPILYQSGAAHKAQRSAIARYFTPATTQKVYREPMEQLADRIMAHIQATREVRLEEMTGLMATAVAAWILGLTEAPVDRLGRLLGAILHQPAFTPGLKGWTRLAGNQALVLLFFLVHVRPAIRARRREQADDVISHLVAQGRTETEILTECITFGAAGMVTTQEFLCLATWQMLRHPDLKERYLAAEAPEREAILYELLRLDPVVGALYRTLDEDVTLPDGDVLPKGCPVTVSIYGANRDPVVAGEEPGRIDPDRQVAGLGAKGGLAFGAGSHRCPGEFVAIQESDIFLQRLLRLPGLRLVGEPRVERNATVAGYEIKDLVVACDGA